MTNVFDDVQKAGRDGVERTIASFGAWTKGVQALAAETADFSKRSFDDSAAHVEKLFGAKSIDSAVTAQTEFLKASYEKALGQANKLGELYVDIAKDVAKPFDGLIPALAK